MDQIYEGSIKIPIEYYIAATVILIVVSLVCFFSRKTIAIPAGLLSAYVFLVLSTTIFSRPVFPDYNYNLKVFWSYAEIINNHRQDLVYENLFNIIMLIPVGFLLPIIKELKVWHIFVVGITFSSLIEVSQLVFRRGLFEFDDIIHNTLGCLIGFALFIVAKLVFHKVKNTILHE